jgi:cytochrome P450
MQFPEERMSETSLPVADSKTGLKALKAMIMQRSLLAPLAIMHEHVGNVFQITLPGFKPAVLVGPKTNRQILVTDRDKFLWRTESDPVTQLLRHGVLVEDGRSHDTLRASMDPALHRKHAVAQINDMWQLTKQVTDSWQDRETVDMLVEMRKLALVILMGTLFKVDIVPHLSRLWEPILQTIAYISPGLWIVWPNMPQHKYDHARAVVDEYLYQIIQERRELLANADSVAAPDDLLGQLIQTADMTDDLIRDQLLTMLIAGHDTSTALLAWILYLLGTHPEAMQKSVTEVDAVLQGRPLDYAHTKQLAYLDQVIKETLRLYPPIHIGNRRTAEDLSVAGYHIPKESRVMYSIYLSHRDKAHWENPDQFIPERFDPQHREKTVPFTYIPFGAGPRNCIGAAFAQIEAKVVMAFLLQSFEMAIGEEKVRPYMGATLEPRPGVIMRVQRRQGTRHA